MDTSEARKEIAPGVFMEPTAWAARVGAALRATREAQGISLRGLAKESNGRLDRGQLKAIEEGRHPLVDGLTSLLETLYELDLDSVFPVRVPLRVSLRDAELYAGGATKQLANRSDLVEDVLLSYIELIWAVRGVPNRPFTLRRPDVETLAETLSMKEEHVIAALAELMQCSKRDARKLFGVLRSRKLVVPVMAVVMLGIGVGASAKTQSLSTSGLSSHAGSAGIEYVAPLDDPNGGSPFAGLGALEGGDGGGDAPTAGDAEGPSSSHFTTGLAGESLVAGAFASGNDAGPLVFTVDGDGGIVSVAHGPSGDPGATAEDAEKPFLPAHDLSGGGSDDVGAGSGTQHPSGGGSGVADVGDAAGGDGDAGRSAPEADGHAPSAGNG
ncbi:MAG: helix-turn-helix transcriptional regulator, partial [Actinobacteria bacterium]|nr:helix-turn-helix transcriptional regulator [Actinomycetota bacterium]